MAISPYRLSLLCLILALLAILLHSWDNNKRGGESRPVIALEESIDDFETQLRSSSRLNLGTPYQWGETDCSWHTRTSGQRCGFYPGWTSRDQHKNKIISGDPRYKNYRFFDTKGNGKVSHVGLVFSDGMLSHASSSKGVIEVPFSAYWMKREVR